MNLQIHTMNEEFAKEILTWTYEKPYDLYNNEPSEEGMNELLDGSYYALIDDVEGLYGFFCIGKSAQVPKGNEFGAYDENCIDMGLGMNPKLVGKGTGFSFTSFIIDYIQERHKEIPVRLTVATFNKRAIHLYEKLGFVKKHEFSTDFAHFQTMVQVS